MCEKKCANCKLFVDREDIPEVIGVVVKPLFKLLGTEHIKIQKTGKTITTGFIDCSAGAKTGLVYGDQKCLAEDEFQAIIN